MTTKMIPSAIALIAVIGGFFAMDLRAEGLEEAFATFDLTLIVEMAIWPIVICCGLAYLFITHGPGFQRQQDNFRKSKINTRSGTADVIIPPYDPDADPNTKR